MLESESDAETDIASATWGQMTCWPLSSVLSLAWGGGSEAIGAVWTGILTTKGSSSLSAAGEDFEDEVS